jgi:hypothetical protein
MEGVVINGFFNPEIGSNMVKFWFFDSLIIFCGKAQLEMCKIGLAYWRYKNYHNACLGPL